MNQKVQAILDVLHREREIQADHNFPSHSANIAYRSGADSRDEIIAELTTVLTDICWCRTSLGECRACTTIQSLQSKLGVL